MRVLLLGGTGFIGVYVARHLANAGHVVAVFHRGETRADLGDNILRLHGDRANLPDFCGRFKQWKADVLIDLIGYTEQEARQSADVFRSIVRHVVVLSSQDVYRAYDRFRGAAPGMPDPVPLAETAPLRETRYPYRTHAPGPDSWLYHYDKMLVEHAYQSTPDLPTTILRLPQVYGPGDRQHRLKSYLEQMDAGAPEIRLDPGQALWRWTRGFVVNIAAAIALVAIAEPTADAIYNLGGAQTDTEAEWIRRIGAVAEWQGEIVEREQPESPSNWQQQLVFDTSRFRDALGYEEPVALEDAIARTVAWERTQQP